MSNLKSQKMASDLKTEISILMNQKLKDPRISSGMISIVRVDVSNDCSFAKIYISSIDGLKKARLAAAGLNSGAGFIKRRISNAMHLKKSPKIVFIADDSIEYGAKLDKIIEELKKDK